MSDRDDFEFVLASLYRAMLDGAHWPCTSALIDEVCGARGNAILVGEGLEEDVRVQTVVAALGLTRAETEVGVWLAEGRTVGEIAAATGRQKRSIYWLLEQIYAKLGVRRQVDLVRLVLAATEFG